MSKLVKLGDVCNISSAGDKPKIFSGTKTSTCNIPVYGNGRDDGGLVGYTDKALIKDEAITISARGSSCGATFYRDMPYTPIVRLLSLTPKKDRANAKYLYYQVKNRGFKSTGSGQPQITIPQIAECKIEIEEDIFKQEKIADILFSIDQKITNNCKIIEISEKLAREIYDYWFVQFEFPDENGHPYRSSGGEMIYDEKLKQSIPKNWSSTKMSAILNMSKKGDWGSDTETPQNDMRVFCVRGTDLDSIRRGPIVASSERFIPSKHMDRILEKGDFVIEISGTPGRSAYINDNLLSQFDSPLISSNFCQIVTPKKPEMLYWFTNLWTSLYESGVADHYSGQTTMKNLQFDIMANSTRVVLPNDDLMNHFNETVEDTYEYIQLLTAENKKLAILRDWLLPMLMSGQIKVGD